MNQLLAKLFATLDDRGVEYLLLRGYGELESAQPIQEIDLLVHPRCLARFESVASRLDFRPWPAWGHEPHLFFLAFDPTDGCWIKLDVVTGLVYGRPVRWLQLDLDTHCWSKRRRVGPTWLPAPEDEFLTLLAHCVLDKERFREAHAARLQTLWRELQDDAVRALRLACSLERYLGPAARREVQRDLEDECVGSVLALGPGLARRLFWRQPRSALKRLLRTWMRRRLRRILFLLHRHGTSTVLLAPDGGGKSTLAAALAEDPWLQARVLYMGGNSGAGGIQLPTTAWLERRIRATRGRWFAPERPLLRALRTVNHLLEDVTRHAAGELHKVQGRFVVYDRYFYDSHLSARARAWRVRLRRWLMSRTCPVPDLVLVLDAPGETLWARKREHTPELLERQRQILLGLAESIHNLEVIDASRSAEEVRRQAVAAIWEDFGRRSS